MYLYLQQRANQSNPIVAHCTVNCGSNMTTRLVHFLLLLIPFQCEKKHDGIWETIVFENYYQSVDKWQAVGDQVLDVMFKHHLTVNDYIKVIIVNQSKVDQYGHLFRQLHDVVFLQIAVLFHPSQHYPIHPDYVLILKDFTITFMRVPFLDAKAYHYVVKKIKVSNVIA